jgi:hypothetical protein
MSNGGGAAAGGRGAEVVGDAIEEDPPPHPNSGEALTHMPIAIKSSRRVVLSLAISDPLFDRVETS